MRKNEKEDLLLREAARCLNARSLH